MTKWIALQGGIEVIPIWRRITQKVNCPLPFRFYFFSFSIFYFFFLLAPLLLPKKKKRKEEKKKLKGREGRTKDIYYKVNKANQQQHSIAKRISNHNITYSSHFKRNFERKEGKEKRKHSKKLKKKKKTMKGKEFFFSE